MRACLCVCVSVSACVCFSVPLLPIRATFLFVFTDPSLGLPLILRPIHRGRDVMASDFSRAGALNPAGMEEREHVLLPAVSGSHGNPPKAHVIRALSRVWNF